MKNRINSTLVWKGIFFSRLCFGFLLFCFLFILVLPGCFGKSREDERQEVEKKRDKMTTISSLTFNFDGYDSAEVHAVVIKEIPHDRKDTITFPVIAEYNVDFVQGVKRWRPSWELRKEISLDDEYLIIISGEAPHLLRNLKMGEKEFNESKCFCDLKEWELDGKVYNYDGITIRKNNR